MTETELRTRLKAGGLAPKAIEKAVLAWKAGERETLELRLVTVEDRTEIELGVPQTLLLEAFPGLAETDPKAVQLRYQINRHRGGRRSLTLRWDEQPAVAPVPTPAPPDVPEGPNGSSPLPKSVPKRERATAAAAKDDDDELPF